MNERIKQLTTMPYAPDEGLPGYQKAMGEEREVMEYWQKNVDSLSVQEQMPLITAILCRQTFCIRALQLCIKKAKKDGNAEAEAELLTHMRNHDECNKALMAIAKRPPYNAKFKYLVVEH